MKITTMLAALVILIYGGVAGAADPEPADTYDVYTSWMLQAYKKEQETCGVEGRELECLSAQYEMERVANHLDAVHGRGCAGGLGCESAPGSFWGM